MPRFAVYYVPPANSDLYQFGTQIKGWDVRAQNFIHPDNHIRARLPDFDEIYVNRSPHFGIHCTLFGAPDCRNGDLLAMVHELEILLNSFAGFTEFRLTAHDEFITFWGHQRQIVALRYQANRALAMLHALIVAKLAPYVSRSHARQRLHRNPEPYPDQEAHRIEHFHYSHIFDGFNPHFTLMNPYLGNQHDAVARVLKEVFDSSRTIVMENICLMVQDEDSNTWRIYHEFKRKDYPRKFEL